MVDARSIPSLLQAHAKVDDIDNDLGVTLRLHRTAHDTKTHQRFSVLHDESRDDGMERPLAALYNVRMTLVERKQLSAILQHEAELSRRHAGTHAAIVALDQRHHVSVLIGNGQVDCIASLELGVTRRQAARCACRIDQFATLCRIFLGN